MQLLIFNEECLVSANHQFALITSLPFVHTARRSYRLNDPVRPPDWGDAFGSPDATLREAVQTLLFRGRRSRNKVSVGEPAEGSLPVSIPNPVRTNSLGFLIGRRAGFGWSTRALGRRSPRARRCRPSRAVWAGVVGMRPCLRFTHRTVTKGSVRVDRELLPALFGALHPTPQRACLRGSALRGPCVRARLPQPKQQLLSKDILAPATMKNAAKCDT